MKYSSRTYELTGISRIFGSQAADPDVHSKFIAAKAASLEKGEEETEMLPEELETRGYTVFLRNNGKPCLSAHVIKGFFKEALSTLKDQLQLKSVTSKVDNLVFIDPPYLEFTRHGKSITDKDEDFERPLRGLTAQGPRVSVVKSEIIQPEWKVRFTLTLLDNNGTAKSVPLSWELIEEALDYGQFKGLGCWRNAQNGRFVWRRVEE